MNVYDVFREASLFPAGGAEILWQALPWGICCCHFLLLQGASFGSGLTGWNSPLAAGNGQNWDSEIEDHRLCCVMCSGLLIANTSSLAFQGSGTIMEEKQGACQKQRMGAKLENMSSGCSKATIFLDPQQLQLTYLRPAQDWARQHSTLDRGGAQEATPLSEGLLAVNGVGKRVSLFKLFM